MAKEKTFREDEIGYRFFKKEIDGKWYRPAHIWEVEEGHPDMIEQEVVKPFFTVGPDGVPYPVRDRGVNKEGKACWRTAMIRTIEYFIPCRPPKAVLGAV